ncbi:MAG: hypothetical protein ACWGQW_20365 [bacterium]
MPTPRKELDFYPEEYWELLRQALQRRRSILCESRRQAHNLRNDLYAFRKQLELSDDPLSPEARKLSFIIRMRANGYAELLISTIQSPNHEIIHQLLENRHANTEAYIGTLSLRRRDRDPS